MLKRMLTRSQLVETDVEDEGLHSPPAVTVTVIYTVVTPPLKSQHELCMLRYQTYHLGVPESGVAEG